MSRARFVAIVLLITTLVVGATGAYFLARELRDSYGPSYISIANFRDAQAHYREKTKNVFELHIRPDAIRHHDDLYIQVYDSEPVAMRDLVEADLNDKCIQLGTFQGSSTFSCGGNRLKFVNGKLYSVSLTGGSSVRIGKQKDNLQDIPFPLEHAVEMFGPVTSYDRMKVVAP